MKKTTILLLTLLSFSFSYAQIVFEGTEDYARPSNIIYDNTIENRLYAVGELGNHILISNDNGLSWNIFYAHPENEIQINDLKKINNNQLSFSLNRTSNLADSGVYILNLSDQTLALQARLPVPANAETVTVIAYDVYEADTNYIIAVQDYRIGFDVFSIVYYTTDGGANWTTIYDQTQNDNVGVLNVAISPDSNQKLFIARGLGPNTTIGGLRISTDAGANWTESLAGIPVDAMAFDPNNSDIIYTGTSISFGAVAENLYRTTDGGLNWQVIPITWDTFLLDTINGIYFNPTNSNNIIVLEENQIVITTDGGTTWNSTTYDYTTDADNIYFFGLSASFNPFNTNEVRITSDYRSFISNDGGNTLIKVVAPFFSSSFAGVFSGNQNHLYYNIQGGFLYNNLTTNTETAYNILPIDQITSDSNFLYVDRFVEGRLFEYINGFIGNTLNVSNDHGATFTEIANLDPALGTVIDLQMGGTNPIVWISVLENQLIRIDYSDINNPVQTSITTPPDPTPDPNEAFFVGAFYVDSANPNTIIIAQNDKVHISTDGGANWTEISNGIETDDIIFQIVKNPNANEYMLATLGGIYKSTDLVNWTKVYTGNNVRIVRYSTENANQLIAATYANSQLGSSAQILYSSDSGDSWGAIPLQDIAYVSSASMDFIFNTNGATVYMATPNLGIVSYNVDFTTLSIDEPNAPKLQVQYYPNPTRGILNLKSINIIDNINLYTVLGQKVMDIEVNTQNPQLNLSTLKSGIYLMQVAIGNQSKTHRIIIK